MGLEPPPTSSLLGHVGRGPSTANTHVTAPSNVRVRPDASTPGQTSSAEPSVPAATEFDGRIGRSWVPLTISHRSNPTEMKGKSDTPDRPIPLFDYRGGHPHTILALLMRKLQSAPALPGPFCAGSVMSPWAWQTSFNRHLWLLLPVQLVEP